MLERPPLSPEAEDVVQLYTKHAVCLVELWRPFPGLGLACTVWGLTCTPALLSTPAILRFLLFIPWRFSVSPWPFWHGTADGLFLPPILWRVKVRRYTALPTGFLKPGPSADKNLPFRMLTPSPFLQLALNYCFPWEPRSPRSLKPTVENQTSREF